MKLFIIFAFVSLLTACVLRGRGGYVGDFIQLFAVQTTLLNETGNDLSPEMKTFYDKRLLYAAQAQLVHHQFGQKRPIPKNGGKTIEFRKLSNACCSFAVTSTPPSESTANVLAHIL